MFKSGQNRRWLLAIVPVVVFIFQTETCAQVTQTSRYEHEFRTNEESYTIIDLRDDGLGLIRSKNKYNGNKKLWEFIRLDTALQELYVSEFHVEERYPLIGYEIGKGSVYFLFRTGENTKNHFLLVQLNTSDGKEVLRNEIKPELDFRITHFNKVGNNLILGGYMTNDPAIILYNLTDKSIKAVPGFFVDDSELADLRVNQNQTFNAVLIDKSKKSELKVVFKTFDEAGNLLLDDVVPIDDERSIQHSISSTLERDELMILGTWSDRQAKQASGFFALPIDPFSEQKPQYYHFGELSHFLDYLNPKRAEKIKEKTKEDVSDGKRTTFSAYVIPHRIIESEDGFFLLAEVYNPVNTQNPYYTSPYGNPYYPNPYYGYNPYWPMYYPGMRYRPLMSDPNAKNNNDIKTFETVLLSFDGTGKLQWDQSMKLDNIEKKSLEQVSDFYYDGAKIVFLAKKESELKIKSVPMEAGEGADLNQKIKLKNQNDELRNEMEIDNGIKHWLGNSFYVWGYQTIRNVDFKEDRTRDVFYINKVVVR